MTGMQAQGSGEASGGERSANVGGQASDPHAALFFIFAVLATGFSLMNALTLAGFAPDGQHFEATTTITEIAFWTALALCLWLRVFAGASVPGRFASTVAIVLAVGGLGWMFVGSMSAEDAGFMLCANNPVTCNFERSLQP